MPYVDTLKEEDQGKVSSAEVVVENAQKAGYREFLRADGVWCSLTSFGTPNIKYFFNPEEKTLELIIMGRVRVGSWPLR